MTNEAKARRIIRREYGDSTNFMTPEPVRYILVGPNRAAELSRGRFGGRTYYGVSVVDVTPEGETVRRTDLSECFEDREAAEAYATGGSLVTRFAPFAGAES